MSGDNRNAGGNVNVKAMTKKDLIVNTLVEQIEAGELAPGARLAGETTLASRFHVSRGTVRQALGELQRRHLIATRSGVGSVVTYDGQTIDQTVGWTAAFSEIAQSITTEVLRIETVPREDVPELPVAVPGDSFVLVARLRRAAAGSGPPQTVSLEKSYIPDEGPLADLPESGLPEASLTATLAKAGLTDAAGEQTVALRLLGPDEAALVDRPEGTPFLRIVRTSFTPSGRFVEHVVSLLDPGHFTVSSKFGMTS
jgi:GntR family transcriptional regulator